MPLSLRINRGLLAAIPSLADGEFYYATDADALYVGDSGNVQLSPLRAVAGSFTHDISTASGNQSISGIGFKPRCLVDINCTGGASNAQASWAGSDDGVTAQCIEVATSGYVPQVGMSMICRTAVSGGNFSRGLVTSFDANGFTIAWTKVGTPTGTATVRFLALR